MNEQNKSVAHRLRIQRQRQKGWRKPEGAVCVTRPGLFGNPFETAKSFERWILAGEISLTDLRREWMPWTPESKERLRQKRDAILQRLPDLVGKPLACFCGLDSPCHADTLCRLANNDATFTKSGT